MFAAAAAGALIAASLASAAEAKQLSPSAVETYTPVQSAQSVEEYWTPERLAAAKDVDLPKLDASADVGTDGFEDAAPQEIVSKPAVVDDVGAEDAAHFSRAVGHLYFTNKAGGNSRCSASALNSDSKRLILTAGHCIHAGDGNANNVGTWHTNILFIPGYHQGTGVAGQFAGGTLGAPQGWTRQGDFRHDMGMVVSGNNASGQRLVDAVGGQGLVTNPNHSSYVHIVGYPSNRDGGQVQWNCWGTTASDYSGATLRLNCGWGPGSSGSPWIRDYASNGYGYAVGNMQGQLGDKNFSPYYGSSMVNLWNAMKNAS
ncbi:MAG: trypsin-like serine peptidase [Stackebrandtia sp.]